MPLGSLPWFYMIIDNLSSLLIAALALLTGSVKPKQPINSPLANNGKYFCFCSSVPYSFIGCMTKDD